jgi:hypothetical protein
VLKSRVYTAATAENATFTYDSVLTGNFGKRRLTQLFDPADNELYQLVVEQGATKIINRF